MSDIVNLFNSIRPGDKVTIRVPSGIGRNGQEYSERSGRAVICSQSTHGTVALNLGGKYGTPGVATIDNFVGVRKAKQRALSARAEQRIADRIDGYDRDDLGESPDY